MSKIPGITAKHRIITDGCRSRGKGIAIEEALESLKEEFEALDEIWPEGEDHKFHVVLTVDNANRRD